MRACTQGELAWRLVASCSGMHPTFFPPDSASSTEVRKTEAEAKEICRQCPVTAACRQFAIDNRELHGVWGGLNPIELRAARKRSYWGSRT